MAPETKLKRLIDMLAQEADTLPLANDLKDLHTSLEGASPEARAPIKQAMLTTAFTSGHEDSNFIVDELSQTLSLL